MDRLSLSEHIKVQIMNYYHPLHTIWDNIMDSLIFYHRKKNSSYISYKLMNDLLYYHKDKMIHKYKTDIEDKKWEDIIIKEL